MTHYPFLREVGHNARRAKGWDIARAGGCQLDLARAEGVTPEAISKWLDMWPELRTALKENSWQLLSTPIDEADKRLRIVALSDIEGRSRSSAAREIGITAPGLFLWLRKRQGELQDTINEINSERERMAA